MHLSHAPKRSLFPQILTYFWIALGAFLAAFAFEVFFIPNNLIDGGIVGVAMIFGNVFGKQVIPLFAYPLQFSFFNSGLSFDWQIFCHPHGCCNTFVFSRL